MSLPEKEVLKSKVCCSCNKEKEIKSFYRNAIYSSGWEPRCKLCKQNRLKCYRNKESNKGGRPKERDTPQLWNVRKEDWIETYNFLKKIGYDLSSDKTIHEQFCERNNLEPKNRTKEKSILFTASDLGLV